MCPCDLTSDKHALLRYQDYWLLQPHSNNTKLTGHAGQTIPGESPEAILHSEAVMMDVNRQLQLPALAEGWDIRYKELLGAPLS